MGTAALTLLAGALTLLSPCVLPILPIVVGSASREHRHGPIALAMGMILSFTFLGLLFSTGSQVIGISERGVQVVGAILLLLFGIILLSGNLHSLFVQSVQPIADRFQTFVPLDRLRGLSGQFVIGACLGMVWSPCAGPMLGGALGLAASSGLGLDATLLLFIYGLGAALPLLIIAYGSRRWVAGRKPALALIARRGRPFFGGLLIVLSFFILVGMDKTIESIVLRNLPDWWINLTSAL